MDTSPNHELVKEAAIEMIQNEIAVLSNTRRLCCPLAECMAVKYKLSGTIPEAVKTLTDIKQAMEDLPAGEPLTNEIRERNEVEGVYRDSYINDSYNLTYIEAVEAGDDRKMDIMMRRERIREDELHDKKDCVCYIAK